MSEALNGVIILPHLRIQNANAVSGPLSWGFPAVTAFTGFVHALQRNLGSDSHSFDGAGVVCHGFTPQVYSPSGGYHWRFSLARHPMGKDGKPPGTIEEGRTHLDISLVIGVRGDLDEKLAREILAREVMQAAMGMRLAGGSILPPATGHEPVCFALSTTRDEKSLKEFISIRRRLVPGFTLIDRTKVLHSCLAELREANHQARALDALLDLSCLKVKPLQPEVKEGEQPPDTVEWRAFREKPGWLVPIPVGYGAISPLYQPGEVKNTRDKSTPFRFVEAIYSLGEWISPHRLTSPTQMIWQHEARLDDGLYLCKTIETID